MSTKRVVLLWDKFTRDYLSLECIRAYLLQLDPSIEVSIEHQDFFITEAGTDFFERTARPASLVVMPSFNYRRMDSVLARVLQQGAALALAHSEQLFPPIFNESKFNLSRADRYRALTCGHLVWGSFYADQLHEQVGVPRESLYVCGNPKFSVLQSRLRGLREEHRGTTEGSAGGRRKILVLSNFLVADYSDREWDAFCERWFVPPQYTLNQWFSEVRKACLAWIQEAAHAHPDVDFLLRPHPGEDEAPYRAACNRDNLILTGGAELVVDLAKADLVLTYTSSAALESIAADIPTYSLDLQRMPEETVQPPPQMHRWIDLPQLQALVADVAAGRLEQHQPSAEQRQALEDSSHQSAIGAWASHAAAIHHLLQSASPPRLSAAEWLRAQGFILRMRLRALLFPLAYHNPLLPVRQRARAWLQRRNARLESARDLVPAAVCAAVRGNADELVSEACVELQPELLVRHDSGWTAPGPLSA
ncbi:MAG TPA: hypothetical protein VLI06_00885 [Solimonas sp.]|nr:hypothetical protein [Solimonas sp.]